MRTKPFTLLDAEDLGGEPPEWFLQFLEHYNRTLEELSRAVNGNLGTENLNDEVTALLAQLM